MYALCFQPDKCFIFYLHTTRCSSLYMFAMMDLAFIEEVVEAGATGDDGLAYLWRGDI